MHEAIASTIWGRVVKEVPEDKIDQFNVQLLALVELEKLRNLPFEVKKKTMKILTERADHLQNELKQKRIKERAEKEEYIPLSHATVQMMEEEFNKRQEIEETFEKYIEMLEQEGLELTEEEIKEIDQEIEEIKPEGGFDFDEEPPF